MIDSAQRDDRRGSPRVLLQVEVSLSEGAEPGFGVAFLKLDDATREAIETFCRQREPMYVEIDRD